MFQQLPGGVGRALGFASAKLRRKIFEFGKGIDMCRRFRKQVNQVPAKRIGVVHRQALSI
jgi:hypothetical protein